MAVEIYRGLLMRRCPFSLAPGGALLFTALLLLLTATSAWAAPDAWSPTGSIANPRQLHTATLLPSGKVLLTGGSAGSGILGSA